MTFHLLGIGTALPPHPIEQSRAAELASRAFCRSDEQAEALRSLFDHAGVASRRTVLPQEVLLDVSQGTSHSQSEWLPKDDPHDRGPMTRVRSATYAAHAPALACAAARGALDGSGCAPREITHLITVSCTGFFAPGIDVKLIEELSLPPTVERTHVGFMGCHGALNALRVAQAFASASPAARILICAVELCSLHYHYGWDLKKLVGNALFSDGAGAIVGGDFDTAAAGPWRVAATGSCLIPGSQRDMTWTIGDHGFEMTLSSRVPRVIARHLGGWLEAWLAGQGLSLDEVGSWAVHPGGPRILEAVEESLGLDSQATTVSREVLAECGNMSSPTVLFILDRLIRRGAPLPCVALGFGPGLVAEAVLFA